MGDRPLPFLTAPYCSLPSLTGAPAQLFRAAFASIASRM